MTTVKLILSYHKPDVLLKDDVLTPVHAGRAQARGRMSSDDPALKWLLENTIGDDTGENISLKNSLYNEMTSVYWAWKNYQDLGNPDYIGFMHYRRHFLFKDGPRPQQEATNLGTDDDYLQSTLGYEPSVVQEWLKEFDFVYLRPQKRPSMREHFERNHHIADLDLALAILSEKYPHLAQSAEEYLAGSSAIFCNMFIMPRQIFFEYAEYIFGVLFELEKRGDFEGKRMFVSEWLTGIFITDLLKRGLKGKALPMVIAEGQHTIPVVVAASSTFVQPMAVTLTSLLENAGANTSYDIYVLRSETYDPKDEAQILELVEKYPGTRIEFITVGDEFDDIEVATSHVRLHTYFRLVIPSKLPKLSRCIYLDTDIVVERDLTPLFRTVVDDKYLAAVAAAGYRNRPDESAAKIGLPSYDQYFNAGVLLMNLDRIRRDGLETRFMELAGRDLESDDQDVLNIACYGGVRTLPLRFNLMTKYFPANADEFFAYLGVRETWTRGEWDEAVRAPVIIHYADKRKPWIDASTDFADRWWHYALLSPMRNEIVADCLSGAVDTAQEKIQSYRRHLVNARRGKGAAERRLASLMEQPTGRELEKYHEAVIAAARLERELQEERARRKATEKLLSDVRGSYSFKTGRAITSVPRLLRRLPTGSAKPAAASASTARPAPKELKEVPAAALGSAGTAASKESAPVGKPTRPKLRRRTRSLLDRVLPSTRRQLSHAARSQADLVKREQQKLATKQWRTQKTVNALQRTVEQMNLVVTDLASSSRAHSAWVRDADTREAVVLAELVQQLETLAVENRSARDADAQGAAVLAELSRQLDGLSAGSTSAVAEAISDLENVVGRVVEKASDRVVTELGTSLSVSGISAEIGSVSSAVEQLRSRMTSTLRAANEGVWADVYGDTIRDSSWFQDQALSPGRWAVGYPFLYVLYRVLDEMQPKSILEFGLGQSTKMVAQYAKQVSDATHVVVEHDDAWVGFFEKRNSLPAQTRIVSADLTVETRQDGKTALRYGKFDDDVIAAKYDLILVDGPYGDDSKDLSRVDVLDLIPDSLSETFVILFDDYNRVGETRTVEELRQKLAESGRSVVEAAYAGNKTMWLGASSDLSFFTSL